MDISQVQFSFLLLVLVLGWIGGFMAGMLGVGGGIIFVPVFQEIVRSHAIDSDKVSYVLANSLLIVLVVGISGTVKQYKLKNTDLKSSLTTGIAAVVSSLLLSFMLQYYKINDQKLFNYIFSFILVLTGLRMWYGKKSKGDNEEKPLVVPPIKHFIPAGLLAGVVTALTGLGGGVIMVPYFNKVLKLPIKFSTGLSLSVIPIIAFPLLVFYSINQPQLVIYEGWQTGFILWPAVIPMIIAAGIASPFGVKAAFKMQPKTLLTIFLTFILINIVKVLFF